MHRTVPEERASLGAHRDGLTIRLHSHRLGHAEDDVSLELRRDLHQRGLRDIAAVGPESAGHLLVAERVPKTRVATRDPGHRRVEYAMGTMISLHLPDGGDVSRAADAAFDWFHEIDARFSPFKSDSEVGRLMRGELAPSRVSSDLVEVLVPISLHALGRWPIAGG